jgi:hypothetical protein
LANTTGAAFGPLIASFVLLPGVGYQGGLIFCAAGYALLSAVAALPSSEPSRKSGRRGDTDSSRGEPQQSTVRTIYSVRVGQKGARLIIEFEGDGFLYKMVRLMVGSLVKCALGKMRVEDVTARLNSGEIGQARFAAPADGLFLVRVRY